MITPSNDDSLGDTACTTGQLAGIPVPVEGHERVAVRPTEAGAQMHEEDRRPSRPTAEDLAGVPICVEGREDLSVRRIVRRQDTIPATSGDMPPPSQTAQV